MALDNLFSTTMAIFSKTLSSDKTPFRYMHRLCAVISYFTVKCFNYTLYSWMLQCTACSHSPPQYSQYIHLVIVFSPLMLLLFAVVLQGWFSIEMHWATAVTTLMTWVYIMLIILSIFLPVTHHALLIVPAAPRSGNITLLYNQSSGMLLSINSNWDSVPVSHEIKYNRLLPSQGDTCRFHTIKSVRM